MACQIKEIAPETQFCGVVQSRASYDFLQSQGEIAYTSLILDEDIHRALYKEAIDWDFLHAIEKEYGIPNLWPYLYIDRIVMDGQHIREYPHDQPTLSYENMLRCVQVNAKAIIDFLDKERPDCVVFSVVGSVVSTMLYHIAKKKGIRVINIDFARIGNRIAYSEIDGTLTWVKEKFDELQNGRTSERIDDARKFLEAFRKQPAPYDIEHQSEAYGEKKRLSALKFLQPVKLLKTFPWYLKTLRSDLRKNRDPDYTDIFIWWAAWDRIKRTMRNLRGFNDLFAEPQLDKPFVYFPLHIEPEIAIMRYAPFYCNQQELVRTVARALPLDTLLYVKEHPGMVGYRTRAYYKELLKIPNVCLIMPHFRGGVLAQHSILTITITSTSAWEALLLKRPVITFGDVFFNDIPGVKRCRGAEDLPHLVKEQLENWKYDEKTLLNYVSALFEDSVEVDFAEMWNAGTSTEKMIKDEGMEDLSHLLWKKIQTHN